jgi:hypothetical protein
MRSAPLCKLRLQTRHTLDATALALTTVAAAATSTEGRAAQH